MIGDRRKPVTMKNSGFWIDQTEKKKILKAMKDDTPFTEQPTVRV